MRRPHFDAGLTISGIAHAGLLLWGLVSFTARPLEAAPNDALPVDIISNKEFTEMTKGVKDAQKVEDKKPVVDKIAEQKLAEEAKNKIAEKKEIKAAPEPPPAAEKPPEVKPEKKPPEVDPIAEALKRDEQKRKQAAAAEKKRIEQQSKFDPNQIAALLDKRAPQRMASTGDALNEARSLGYVEGKAAQISQTELDALRRRLSECWSPPVGAANAPGLKVVLRVLFRKDGSVAAPPQLVAGTASSFGPAMAESAQRAILTCQPFKMLRAETYEQWKDIEITFDPREMFRS